MFLYTYNNYQLFCKYIITSNLKILFCDNGYNLFILRSLPPAFSFVHNYLQYKVYSVRNRHPPAGFIVPMYFKQ